MASPNSFSSEKQYECSICLDVFTDPVSTPCGHNFCKLCISCHWEDKKQCQCPLCNAKFSKGLELCVNTTFRDVVENFKKISEVPKNEIPVKPEDVLCDYCLHTKRKASKTCLVCLASYCETHLESHHRVPALKTRHKLTDPVQKLEEKICSKHNMILESLCSNDPTPACALCIKHDAAPVEEEHQHQKPPTVNKNEEVQGKKGKQRKNAKEKNDKHKAPPNSVGDFEDSRDVCICCDQYCRNFSKVPPNKAISKGRFYYEVHTKGLDSWTLGVVSESKRWRRTFGPNDMNQTWMIALFSCRKCTERNPNAGTIQRVFVCVDYDEGIVFFCDADNRVCFYILREFRFRQKLFLFSQPGNLIKGLPCIERHTAQKLNNKPLLYLFLFIIAFFIVIIVALFYRLT